VIRHVSPNGVGQVVFWPSPPIGTTSYWFNNLVYDINNGGNYFDIGQNSNGGDQGTMVLFNNTFEQNVNSIVISCNTPYAHPFVVANNHYILEAGSPYGSPCTGGTYVTNLAQTHVTATTQGYTASETFAYSPASAGGGTVGQGTNEQTFCDALATAGLSDAAVACRSGFAWAAIAARPASGNWDVGAYQYASGTHMQGAGRTISSAPALPLVCENPLPQRFIKRLVSEGISIYGKDGRLIRPNQIKQDGVYIFRDKQNKRAQKVIVLK
jgi:hypothetical protein